MRAFPFRIPYRNLFIARFSSKEKSGADLIQSLKPLTSALRGWPTGATEEVSTQSRSVKKGYPEARGRNSRIPRLSHSLFTLLFSLVLFGSSFLARGTTVQPPSFKELVSQADTIIEGEVTEVSLFWKTVKSEKFPFSNVVIKVSDILKNPENSKGFSPSKETYTLQIFGGEIGGTISAVAGAPLFSKGDKALFFISSNGELEIPLVGIAYGHFWIEKHPKTALPALYKGDGTPLLGREEIDAISRKGSAFLNPRATRRKILPSDKSPISLSDFKNQVLSLLHPNT